MSGDTFPADLDSTTGEEVVVGFWARYWRGQGRLVIAFWIIGVIGAIVLNVVQQVMIALGIMLYYFDKAGASTVTPLIYAAFGLWIVYVIYASVANLALCLQHFVARMGVSRTRLCGPRPRAYCPGRVAQVG